MTTPQSIFDGIQQSIVQVNGFDCTLPLFYTGGTATMGVFLANLAKLRDKAPSPDFEPAAVLPGIAAVNVISFEFETTIGPVNELCIAVPLKSSTRMPYGLSMLEHYSQEQMPVWIWHLPVSTEIADVFGRETWGFPKIHADIPIQQTGDQHSCGLSHQGQPILTLKGKIPATGTRHIRMRLKNHLWQNGALQTAAHLFDLHDVSFNLLPGALKLETLSNHAIAQDLDDVLISKRSVLALRSARLQAILHEPERLRLSLAKKLLNIG